MKRVGRKFTRRIDSGFKIIIANSLHSTRLYRQNLMLTIEHRIKDWHVPCRDGITYVKSTEGFIIEKRNICRG